MTTPTAEEVADTMYALIRECHGKRNLKALDLTRHAVEKYGAAECSKDLGKQAIRLLIESGRCVYTYQGGSWIVLNPDDSPVPATGEPHDA